MIDSTKDPPFAFVVRAIPGIDVRLVHLVRDSRGVTYSWMKPTLRPEVRSGAWMHQYSPASAALRWLDYNALFALLARSGTPRILVHYEEMITEPERTLMRVVRHAGHAVPETEIREVLAGDRPARGATASRVTPSGSSPGHCGSGSMMSGGSECAVETGRW